MATFRELIEGIEDNNQVNDAAWSDWTDLAHIEEVYGALADEDVTREEAKRIVSAAIASNGATLPADLAAIELRVQGQNFSGSWWYRLGRAA